MTRWEGIRELILECFKDGGRATRSDIVAHVVSTIGTKTSEEHFELERCIGVHLNKLKKTGVIEHSSWGVWVLTPAQTFTGFEGRL